jgi:hypothetical protein
LFEPQINPLKPLRAVRALINPGLVAQQKMILSREFKEAGDGGVRRKTGVGDLLAYPTPVASVEA